MLTRIASSADYAPTILFPNIGLFAAP